MSRGTTHGQGYARIFAPKLFEQQMKVFAPGWMAYDMRLMMGRIQKDGMLPNPGDTERLTTLLGRPLRSYRDFAAETAK